MLGNVKVKVYIDHCGASLKRIVISPYNLDSLENSIRALKKLPNLEEMILMKFCSDRLNTQPMTMEIMRVVSELTSLKALEL